MLQHTVLKSCPSGIFAYNIRNDGYSNFAPSRTNTKII
jgi:hypothetical protein